MEDRTETSTPRLLNLPSETLLPILSHLNFDDLKRCPKEITWKQQFLNYFTDYGCCIEQYKKVRLAWNKIEEIIQTLDRQLAPQLNGPATEDEIRAAESRMGCRFPDDLRCSLKLHNGQSEEGFGLCGCITVSSYFQSEKLLDCDIMANFFMEGGGKALGCVPISFCNMARCSQLLAILPTGGFELGQVFYLVPDSRSDEDFDQFITASSYAEWITELADSLSDVFPKIQGSHFRFVNDPSCVAVTDEVFTVKVATCFIADLSSVHPPNFQYSYRITMSMAADASRDLSCQLETRHWVITDEDGREEYVDGPGVVGEFPTMTPGSEYSWVSCTAFSTTYGNMKGYFSMRNLKTGDRVNIECPCFHMKCLPYEHAQQRRERLLELKKEV
ncbi:F-box only protein 3-like isoform X2 [Gigantopelta aegis]|uniref:F-box only protein 3-like isoform X2 n=1 Tax=Gigantopelta aegis TaxID=1735272 RepID=UPI001B88C6F2|nr:F-box only protein 3-like isoform X2 [Gigantopelta aegis]